MTDEKKPYDEEQVAREVRRILRRFGSQNMSYLTGEEILWRALLNLLLSAYGGDMRGVVNDIARTVCALDERETGGEFVNLVEKEEAPPKTVLH